MRPHSAILITITISLFLVAILAFAPTSWARSQHGDWQTGRLVKQETLTPTYTLGRKIDCSFPQAIFTVESSIFTYQFAGFPFDLNSYSTLPSIVFRIYADGNVRVRDPKTGRPFQLRLFRKIAGPTYIRDTVQPSRKLKHRDWMNAEVSAAIPHVMDATGLFVLASTPKPNIPPPCAYHTTWEYMVEAQGKSYVLSSRDREPLNVTVHGVSEVALGKNSSAYLIDDNGKEHKLWLTKTSRP